jgi:hypothetical protein
MTAGKIVGVHGIVGSGLRVVEERGDLVLQYGSSPILAVRCKMLDDGASKAKCTAVYMVGRSDIVAGERHALAYLAVYPVVRLSRGLRRCDGLIGCRVGDSLAKSLDRPQIDCVFWQRRLLLGDPCRDMQAIDAAARVIRVDRYDVTAGEQVEGHRFGVCVDSTGLDEYGKVGGEKEADRFVGVLVDL